MNPWPRIRSGARSLSTVFPRPPPGSDATRGLDILSDYLRRRDRVRVIFWTRLDESQSAPAMAVVEIHRHRFTVEDFAHMGEAGIFAVEDRVELIDGEIREMTPIGPSHAGIVDRLAELLIIRLAGRANVRIQNPIRLGRYTEPQPDITVLAPRDDYYTTEHPEPGDTLLVIEVADSSLLYDRLEKAPRYARAGIPEMWIVDVGARTVIVYTGPGPDGYRSERVVSAGETVTSTGVAGLRLPVDEMFG